MLQTGRPNLPLRRQGGLLVENSGKLSQRKNHPVRSEQHDVFRVGGACHREFGRESIGLNQGDEGICRIDSREILEKLYRATIPVNSSVITYCNSGRRASVSYLVLRSLGYDASVYDGSWLEWGNDESLPIELPDGEPIEAGS